MRAKNPWYLQICVVRFILRWLLLNSRVSNRFGTRDNQLKTNGRMFGRLFVIMLQFCRHVMFAIEHVLVVSRNPAPFYWYQGNVRVRGDQIAMRFVTHLEVFKVRFWQEGSDVYSTSERSIRSQSGLFSPRSIFQDVNFLSRIFL